jgi:hypothetical protein
VAQLFAPLQRNGNGDQTGRIRNSTKEERENHPIIAGVKDFLHGLAEAVGLNGVDDLSANVRDLNDKGELNSANGTLAALNLIMLLPGEGEPLREGPKGPVQPYEVGNVKDLYANSRPGDDLAIHHAVQGHPAEGLIEGYDRRNAPGIALPTREHRNIPTFKGSKTAGSPRQQLAKDIRDLRNYTDAPNEKLQELIDLNKMMYQKAFKK